jgi:hypothetical protein
MAQSVPLPSVKSVKSVVPIGPSAGPATTRFASSFASSKFTEFLVFHGGLVPTDDGDYTDFPQSAGLRAIPGAEVDLGSISRRNAEDPNLSLLRRRDRESDRRRGITKSLWPNPIAPPRFRRFSRCASVALWFLPVERVHRRHNSPLHLFLKLLEKSSLGRSRAGASL